MRSLLVKEIREILPLFAGCWIVLAAIIVWAHIWHGPPGLAAGFVCAGCVVSAVFFGGSRFASEREADTLSFLISLPQPRRAIWLAKAAVGWLATIAVTPAVLAPELWLQSDPVAHFTVYAVGDTALAGMVCYFATLFCSTVLASASLAVVAGPVLLVLEGCVAVCLVNLTPLHNSETLTVALLGLCVTAWPVLSLWLFCRK